MTTAAEAAWAGERKAHARSAYIAGYERGSFEERLRVVAFIGENQELLKTYAGDKGLDMLAFILRELAPETHDSGSTDG